MKLDHTGKILELTGLNVRNTYIQDSQGAVVPPANAGDAGMIPGSGRSPGGGKGNPLQYSHLENPMDQGAWWATAPGVAKSWTQLSMHICNIFIHNLIQED